MVTPSLQEQHLHIHFKKKSTHAKKHTNSKKLLTVINSL